MSAWLAEYSSALDARDVREQAHCTYINAYTKLADRTAALQSSPGSTPLTETLFATPLSKAARPSTPRGKSSPSPAETPITPDSLIRMRTDLTNAQNARIALESRLASLTSELSALRVHSHAQSRQINQLEQAKEQLERRAKDQTDELQGKGKFVIGVQDEMVALELQLNMAEQKVDRLQKDNDELTKRWMAKIEQEANEMNKSPFTR